MFIMLHSNYDNDSAKVTLVFDECKICVQKKTLLYVQKAVRIKSR